MNVEGYNEKDVSDAESIIEFISTIRAQKTELIVSSNGKNVGVILTAEQYDWFLDKLDAIDDIEPILDRLDDMEGTQGLGDSKKEFDK